MRYLGVASSHGLWPAAYMTGPFVLEGARPSAGASCAVCLQCAHCPLNALPRETKQLTRAGLAAGDPPLTPAALPHSACAVTRRALHCRSVEWPNACRVGNPRVRARACAANCLSCSWWALSRWWVPETSTLGVARSGPLSVAGAVKATRSHDIEY